MSIDIIVSISILVSLTYIIWRLNRTSRLPRSKINSAQNSNAGKLAARVNTSSQASTLVNVNELQQTSPEFQVPTDFLDFKLLVSKKLGDEQNKVIADISQSFRKPHPLLLPLTQGGFEPNELFDLIKTDAEMTAKVLNAVNSPLFALRQPITNINHAIIFLGISQVKNIALQIAVQNNVEFTDKVQNDAFKKLWTASYLASSFCLLITKEMNEENPAELSTHCLLSYLGDLAILSYKPSIAGFYLDDFTLFERTKVFQNTISINAAVVGKYLAQQWQLPKSIETGIEHSILPLTQRVTDNELSREQIRQIILCYLSCRLADLVVFGDVKDVSKLGELSFDTLGEVEFYYLQENINDAGLNKVNTLFTDTTFSKKINKVIEQTLAD